MVNGAKRFRVNDKAVRTFMKAVSAKRVFTMAWARKKATSLGLRPHYINRYISRRKHLNTIYHACSGNGKLSLSLGKPGEVVILFSCQAEFLHNLWVLCQLSSSDRKDINDCRETLEKKGWLRSEKFPPDCGDFFEEEEHIWWTEPSNGSETVVEGETEHQEELDDSDPRWQSNVATVLQILQRSPSHSTSTD